MGETNGGTEASYAMEFVEGETLEARVRRVGPLSIRLVLEVGIEVARALVAACHQDLIHRDLKPANLMLVASAEAATVAAVGTESSHGEASEGWMKVARGRTLPGSLWCRAAGGFPAVGLVRR